jgi:hypothetical protein
MPHYGLGCLRSGGNWCGGTIEGKTETTETQKVFGVDCSKKLRDRKSKVELTSPAFEISQHRNTKGIAICRQIRVGKMSRARDDRHQARLRSRSPGRSSHAKISSHLVVHPRPGECSETENSESGRHDLFVQLHDSLKLARLQPSTAIRSSQSKCHTNH